MIVAERGKAELAGCFHGELSYPERQRPDATPASGVMDEPGEEVTHRAEPIRPGEELRGARLLIRQQAKVDQVVRVDELVAVVPVSQDVDGTAPPHPFEENLKDAEPAV